MIFSDTGYEKGTAAAAGIPETASSDGGTGFPETGRVRRPAAIEPAVAVKAAWQSST
jgi:hypothetical protein